MGTSAASRRQTHLILDAGALIGLDRGVSRVLALLRGAGEDGLGLAIPASVVGQVWRGGSRSARLARLLAGGHLVDPLDLDRGRGIGELLANARTTDVVDAHVVLLAQELHSPIVTSDPDDLSALDPSLSLIRLS